MLWAPIAFRLDIKRIDVFVSNTVSNRKTSEFGAAVSAAIQFLFLFQCDVPEMCEQSLCSFSRIQSAVADQMNGAYFYC